MNAGPGRSVIHRLDARGRVLAVAAFAPVCVSLDRLDLLGAAVALAALPVALAGLPWRDVLRRLLAVDGFVFVLLLALPFTVPGEAAFHLAGFPASAEGLSRAAAIALKANAVALAVLGLIGTMEPGDLGHALARLGLSDKFVHLFLFTARYVEVMRREFQRLRRAMRARAFVPRNAPHTWRSYGYLVGMVLVRSLERSERVLRAMKCRGFTGRFHLIDDLAWRPADGLFGLVTLAAMAALLALEAR